MCCFSSDNQFNTLGSRDGNLSIPLYVRGKVVSEGKGEYATNGLRIAVAAWEKSSEQLDNALKTLLTKIDFDS